MKLKNVILQDKYVLIKRDEIENKTKSGLIFNEGLDRGLEYQGTVVATDKEHLIRKGTKVIYKKWSVLEVKIEDDIYDAVLVDDIIVFGGEE